MKSIGTRLSCLAVCGMLAAGSIGCQTKAGTGAAVGTGLGALAGAVVGHQTGKKEEGALVGAAIGGITGGLLGNAEDQKDRADAAVAQASHEASMRQYEQRAMTNSDVISMKSQGFSDQHIANTMRHRGGRFQTDPAAQAYLLQNGVSESLINTMQGYSTN